MEKPTWKKLKSEVVYENRWMKLLKEDVVQPDGEESIYTFLDVREGTIIVAEDSDGKIFLIEEYRFPIKKAVWLLPMGMVGAEETPEENSKIELREETGITAKDWEKLGSYYPYTGKANAIIHVYLAKDLNLEKIGINQEGDESIWQLKKASIDEVREMIKNNEIESGEALAALSMYLNKK